MTTYAIDSNRQGLRATGVVVPVLQWVEDPTTGKRKRSKSQDFDESGTPLWAVEVQYLGESFGEPKTEIVSVQVPAPSQPSLPAFEVVSFEGLTVSVTPNRQTGALRESWRAAGLVGAGVQSRKDAA